LAKTGRGGRPVGRREPERIEASSGFGRQRRAREACVEKVRAALAGREPAVRDVFDRDHAVRRILYDHRGRAVLGLVVARLSVAGNNPVDLSAAEIAKPRARVGTHLRPVLRTMDYGAFDLLRAVSMLEELVQLLAPSPS